jgi:hypothetical protein
MGIFKDFVSRHVWISLASPDANSRRAMIVYWRDCFSGIHLISWSKGNCRKLENFLSECGVDFSW